MATLDDVYCKFGEVSEAAQLLETELATNLFEIEAGQADLLDKANPEEAGSILKDINGLTLGRLIKKLGSSTEDVSRLKELLERALDERNRLSHSFYRQHNFRRNSSDGCDIMIVDLNEIHETLLEAYKAILLLRGVDLDKAVLEALPSTHLPLK